MGFFDRFSSGNPSSNPTPGQPTGGGVIPRLADARTKLEAREVPAAMAIYQEVLASAGARPDVLVAISGDLGSRGHVRELIEVVAPHYDAARHGPATGLNLLQAYLAIRDLGAAQHVLDILFSLQRPELEERLFGFSNAIAELMAGHEGAAPTAAEIAGQEPPPAAAPGATAAAAAPVDTKISLASISKPIWYYGLEQAAPQVLASQAGKLRRIAFAQASLPGVADVVQRSSQPEDDLGRFCRGLALWFAETFAAAQRYEPIAAVALSARKHYVLLPVEWTGDNIRELNESTTNGLDYVVTFSLRIKNEDFELTARIWEVKKFRELKRFTTRWTPASADTALKEFHEQLRLYLEWTALPEGYGLPYAAPVAPVAHVHALGATLTQFFGEKGVLAPEQVSAGLDAQVRNTEANPENLRSQLTLVSSVLRQKVRGEVPDASALARAQAWLASDPAQKADLAALLIKLA